MPFDRTKYPAEWRAFSLSIRRDRAEGRCECTGECGRSHYRFFHRGDRLIESCRCEALNGMSLERARVVLTVAHLNAKGDVCQCEPRCANPEHVKAMCQACHLSYDRERHIENRKRNRREKLACGELFPEDKRA